ncbi:hypothetical protein QFC22_003412 [Naganishia vaughanmartiniae]|uniref:Uncharacterized protein n=1 Tax=Naganishia vaughanmartiniae TaxID=1424756 RepID=A0ACC2XA84_9TREE|nr:hypothetical protein QFC22_003412 [Naganishia vaughanmartiniae]
MISPDNNHSVLTNANNNTPQQSVAGQQPYRMALQLPEGKRLKLQQHEQTKFQQQRQQGPIVQGGGHQQQQQHPMEPGAQGQQRGSVTYYSNPDYQQPSSASRPSFAQASSSYQPQIGPTSHSQQFHGQVQGNPQGNPYQYVQVPQQAQTQQSQNPSSNTGMNMKRGNPSAGLSAPNQNPNANYQMYNMAGLPSSARPATGSGRDGNEMMNMQVGNGSSYQDQATRLNMDSRIEASGSSSGGMADSGTYGEYGVQLSGSSIKSGRLAQQQAPLDVSASGMHPPADMPAFSSMPFEYGSSSAAGPSGTGTVSGYQVGSAPGTGNDMSHSFDQRGQSSVYQDKPNQGPSRYNSGKTQSEGQSGSVDQETFEVSLEPWFRGWILADQIACYISAVHAA